MLLKGGPANSGMKRPKGEKPTQHWIHVCPAVPASGGVVLAAYWARCPDCRTKRP